MLPSPDLYPGVFSPRPYNRSQRTMFSLGCSCGHAENRAKLPQGQGNCFSYVVSLDGVHVCYPENVVEDESIGEEEIENDCYPKNVVGDKSIGEEETENDCYPDNVVEGESTGKEETENDWNPENLVGNKSIGEEEAENDSQALVKYEGTEVAGPERECSCSLLQRRGISLSRLHLALSPSNTSTLVNHSSDGGRGYKTDDGPCSEDGKYEFVKQIGVDGEGVIDLMRTRSARQLVVRKTVDYARSVCAKPIEAAILQDILAERHNHIIDLNAFESYQAEGARYFFEYCSGGDLHQLVSQYNKERVMLPEPFIWQVYQQMASALDFLHQGFDPRCSDQKRGICHRDIKPANIFLRIRSDSEYPDVVLADFGHATLDFATYDPAGTTIWQPPELPRHSPRGDIYSLGAVIHFLIHFEAPIAPMPNGLPDTEVMKDAWLAVPEARRPIMDFVDGYSKELICMMLIALEADENRRKNSSQLLKYVNACIERMFPPASHSLRKAAKDWPMESWAFDYMLSAGGRCEDDEDDEYEEEGTGADQYFEMMEMFGCANSRESSLSFSSASSDWQERADSGSSRECGGSSDSSFGETC